MDVNSGLSSSSVSSASVSSRHGNVFSACSPSANARRLASGALCAGVGLCFVGGAGYYLVSNQGRLGDSPGTIAVLSLAIVTGIGVGLLGPALCLVPSAVRAVRAGVSEIADLTSRVRNSAANIFDGTNRVEAINTAGGRPASHGAPWRAGGREAEATAERMP